jgi:hypothetical protein
LKFAFFAEWDTTDILEKVEDVGTLDPRGIGGHETFSAAIDAVFGHSWKRKEDTAGCVGDGRVEYKDGCNELSKVTLYIDKIIVVKRLNLLLKEREGR